MNMTKEEAITLLDDLIGMVEDNHNSDYDTALRIGSKAIEQTAWIPVSERLPEEDKTVIASTAYGVYGEAKYTKRYGWEWAYEAGADYWASIRDAVDAWMHLPKPYKAESSTECSTCIFDNTDACTSACKCDTCKHKNDPWDAKPCDSCCGAHCRYEKEE